MRPCSVFLGRKQRTLKKKRPSLNLFDHRGHRGSQVLCAFFEAARWRPLPHGRTRCSGLPFRLTFCIIIVCLDLAGLFRNKDIRLVLMIRLARMGARKQPHYRIVVIEKARARNGRPVEVIGTYNPRTNPASVELKRDRVEYWVSKGAQMSERVNKLFSKAPAAAPVPAA